MAVISSISDWLFGRNRKVEFFQGKVVLVTGASSGIGKQLAKDLHKLGSKVILASRSTEQLAILRDELITEEMESHTIERHIPKILTLDLENLNTIEAKAAEAVSLFGRVDILINNAGMTVRGGCLETELSVYSRLMTVNFLGVVELSRHIVPAMVTRGSGELVVVSSVQGVLPIPFRGAYTASKHAVAAWCDSLRAELAGSGVGVTVISPGYVNTNLSRNALTSSGERYGQLDSTTKAGYSVELVSEEILRSVAGGRRDLVLAPVYVRLAILMRSLAPGLYRYVMARRAEKERKQQ